MEDAARELDRIAGEISRATGKEYFIGTVRGKLMLQRKSGEFGEEHVSPRLANGPLLKWTKAFLEGCRRCGCGK